MDNLRLRTSLSSRATFAAEPDLQPVLIPRFSDGDSGLDFALGLGLDLDIRLARHFDLRASGSVGDLEGFAVSFAWVQ